MADIIISIWFFIIFIPSIYIAYNSLQCFDYEKILKKGKDREFKIIYFMVCVSIAFLFASAFTELIQKVYDMVMSLSSK